MSTPQTPIAQRIVAIETPASLRKRHDLNSSYIEEEDATYSISDSESSDDDDSTFEGDEMTKEEILDYEIEADGDNFVAIIDEKPAKEAAKDAAKEAASSFTQFLVRNEIPRKAFHSFHGFLSLWFYCHGFQRRQFVWSLWLLFAVVLANDVLRLTFPKFNKVLVKWMGLFIRDSEVNGVNGIVFYLAGLALVFTFGTKDIAMMSVLLLSWADTAASTFGRQFGKYTPKVAPGKSLAGSLASAFTGLVVCYLFYGYFVPQYSQFNLADDIYWTPATSKLSIHTFALVCAFAASISEAIDVAGIDDNFTIPVLGSMLLSGAVWVFHK